MQVFGTDIMREWYNDVWAFGSYKLVERDGCELAIFQDGRFPNECLLGKGIGLNVKTIRLSRNIANDNHPSETALDNFEADKYDLFVDNRNMTMDEQFAFIEPYIVKWFEESGII
jgi:hypothetical protein